MTAEILNLIKTVESGVIICPSLFKDYNIEFVKNAFIEALNAKICVAVFSSDRVGWTENLVEDLGHIRDPGKIYFAIKKI